MMTRGDRFSDAIRLLLLIATVPDPLNEAEQQAAPRNAVAVLRAEGRLQKLDFWSRNPDYMADELLNDYEREREKEAINLELAGGVLDSDEPEICAIPMLRYLFGAFEYIDQAMSVLAAPRLVVVVPRRTAERVICPWPRTCDTGGSKFPLTQGCVLDPWSPAEQLGQHLGFADLGLLGRGEERQSPVFGEVAQVSQRVCMLGIFEFGPVAMAELREAFRVVAVPLAQFRGRGNLLAPLVEMGLLLGHSPWPDAVDQHSGAVGLLRSLVDPADVHGLLACHGGTSW
jgi:hypothetical protein